MDNKNKKPNYGDNFQYFRFNSSKIKPNFINKFNKEVNNVKKNENPNVKNDDTYKKPKLINDSNKDSNYNNDINFNLNNNKINEFENNNNINSTQDQINKLKKENEELQKHVDKKNKLIIDLKDRCNEQKSMIEELMKKIDNIKKFIPDSSYKKDRKKENDKLEEQLAIAAVEEQIIKELCPNNSNQETMDKILNGEKNNEEANKIKDKIMNIPQVYYKKNQYDNFECYICYDEFKDNELLKQIKCKHLFHKECLSQWLMNNNNCPVCNQIC